jgi:hypothetical protein
LEEEKKNENEQKRATEGTRMANTDVSPTEECTRETNAQERAAAGGFERTMQWRGGTNVERSD